MSALFFPRLLAICAFIVPIGYTMAQMPGAPFDVAADRCDVRQAAQFAVGVYNAEATQEMYAYKLTAVISSRTQVVEGLNYFLNAELGLTWCLKAQARDAETCPLQTNGKRLLCRFTVWTIPWRGVAMLTEKSCIDRPFRPRCYRRSLTQGPR